MTWVLFLLLVAPPIVLFWSASRAAAEQAIVFGREACKRAGVQWLDQSAHQVRLRLCRDSRGRLAWERQFRFEYSTAGRDRHAGLVTMQGVRLTALVGPMPPPDPETVH
jgi:hypothetical protein